MFAYIRPRDFTTLVAPLPMNIGDARLSTQDQQRHLQADVLHAADCVDIVQQIACTSKGRPQWQPLLNRLRASNTLVVWKLGRLSQSLKDLVMLVPGF